MGLQYHIPRSWLQKSDHLLIIFEEFEKTPFNVTIKLRFSATICGQVSENHYPPLDMWSDTEFRDGKLSEGDMASVMSLRCGDCYSNSLIEFASYRTPQARCQACKRRNSCSIGVLNALFGDPCQGIVRTLASEATCLSTYSSSSLK